MDPSLNIYDFGRKLLEINDLDPVYVVLHKAHIPRRRLYRWLLAFWCFYHSGTSSWIADSKEEKEFWKRMSTAAGSKEYPRCHERRHFRGENARKSVEYLRGRGVEDLFRPLVSYPFRMYSVSSVMKEVQTWVGFGPWISFKVADMLERLGLCRINFDSGAMFLFESPQRAAEMLWEEENKGPLSDSTGEWAVDRILSNINPIKAPPRYERLINSQEAETILCKYKSYRNGHYKIGEDISNLYKGLNWRSCGISEQLIEAGNGANLWLRSEI